ncbi:hypothetical protein P153DRAFT_340297 [Dothidotthia symphoricarpi CBS 119687]|uniref:Uncharacterized protein n=1 Tax=Dothidotthia symphoricarpi CBS 119687 TaxID=1392245 RepID=A0A6A6AEL1_9PLEO|nr:uncharacterized protein P153DRAFT_340297 [Dothidotthia symphoricarpi CBS 119687]KAF2129448.1 hypothetical protein P153DRAFT_340297 [Dothidotthia symphoricarpi CBS 119687]
MFSSFLRSGDRRPVETTPLLAALNRYRNRQDAEPSEDEDNPGLEGIGQYDGEDEDEDEDRRRDGPLLPVFSSEFLDRVPIYNATHAIRTILVQRCETTLSWDQLRSPQVSQFLVKPIQQQIRSDHFSRGALYCLLANCLQFRKEGETNPGNMGVSKTRALICELLAMRLLKEFNTRELIDALSYDFDPLQGLEMSRIGTATPGGANWARQARSARISTLEIAIRAQAKKFLAHPLCVQQLEAIWAGTIVFHSAADSLHRKPDTPRSRNYDTPESISPGRGPSRRPPVKQVQPQLLPAALLRRTVTLYDPHDASLFKLSRLRVPRYRNMFSTLSFGIMLGLFLAVLVEKSDDITGLEVLFWFWSAGYMLDEIVGFSEQGFGLYIMSVWNAFDLGILLMFMVYYILRLYGILVPGVGGHQIASMAYNVLGSTAVLLFPRLFSALDHYRYFSQLLIAFKMMAMDLVAILVLIVIACSGFFVAFSLAFSNEFGASNAAYAIFQLVMGFTPAAWDLWGEVNILGKFLLALFLFICHFLVVTILITVLTNSFMAVVKNADEEHQFLFAVNTISMVKSDALFSYIPPTNIIGWLLIPFKYTMSFKRFLRMNRWVIKLTHIPILFTIFVYERLLLAHLSYGPADLVESRGRPESSGPVPAFSIRGEVFSARLREPSVTTFHKDRALEEVFRRPFRDTSVPAASKYPSGRRNSSNVVSDWMKKMNDDDEYNPPQEDARSILDRLEGRNRPYFRRARTAGQPRRKLPFPSSKRAASDPDDIISPFARPIAEEEEPDMNIDDEPQQTDADGDDELLTNDEDDRANSDTQVTPKNRTPSDKENQRRQAGYETSEEDFFRTPMTAITRTPARDITPQASSFQDKHSTSPDKKQVRQKISHSRNLSSSTVLFSPTKEAMDLSRAASPERRPKTGTRSGVATPGRLDGFPMAGTRTPKRPATSTSTAPRPRAILPPRDIGRQGPSVAHLLDHRQRAPSFNAIALDLASDIGDNNHNPNFGNVNTLPASFTTQFEMAARMKAHEQRKTSDGDSDSNRMSRIMLARMTTLEEGFRDVLKEVKGLNRGDNGSSQAPSRGTHTPPNELVKKKGKGKKKSSRRDSGEDRMGSSV